MGPNPCVLCTKPASNPEGECTLVAVTTKHFAAGFVAQALLVLAIFKLI
jgi:hypothetical protein